MGHGWTKSTQTQPKHTQPKHPHAHNQNTHNHKRTNAFTDPRALSLPVVVLPVAYCWSMQLAQTVTADTHPTRSHHHTPSHTIPHLTSPPSPRSMQLAQTVSETDRLLTRLRQSPAAKRSNRSSPNKGSPNKGSPNKGSPNSGRTPSSPSSPSSPTAWPQDNTPPTTELNGSIDDQREGDGGGDGGDGDGDGDDIDGPR